MWSNQNLYIANGSVKWYNHFVELLDSFLKVNVYLLTQQFYSKLFVLEKGNDSSTKIFCRIMFRAPLFIIALLPLFISPPSAKEAIHMFNNTRMDKESVVYYTMEYLLEIFKKDK